MNPLPWIVATVVAGLIAGASWFAYGLGGDRVRAEWAEERAEMQGEALAAAERYRALEQRMAKVTKEARDARTVEAAAHSRMVLALAESDGLRREMSAPTRIYIGSEAGTSRIFSGTIKSARVHSHTKPAAEMAQLTA